MCGHLCALISKAFAPVRICSRYGGLIFKAKSVLPKASSAVGGPVVLACLVGPGSHEWRRRWALRLHRAR